MRSPSEAKRSGPIPVVSICRIRPETANLKGLSKVVEPFLEPSRLKLPLPATPRRSKALPEKEALKKKNAYSVSD